MDSAGQAHELPAVSGARPFQMFPNDLALGKAGAL